MVHSRRGAGLRGARLPGAARDPYSGALCSAAGLSSPPLSPPRGRNGNAGEAASESGSAGHVSCETLGVRSNKTGYKGTQLNRLLWSSPREGMEVNGQSVNRFQSQSRSPFPLTTESILERLFPFFLWLMTVLQTVMQLEFLS